MTGAGRLTGVILVLLGASCYGILATLVKSAYLAGYTPAEVLSTQFVLGAAVLTLADAVCLGRGAARPGGLDLAKLLLAGVSIGAVGTFYYMSVALIGASLAIVLLMQSVWMSVGLDALLTRRRPSPRRLAGAALVIAGAVLATDALGARAGWNAPGIAYGALAAFANTAVIWCSAHVATHIHPLRRASRMMLGGAIVTLAYVSPGLIERFDWHVIWPWGAAIAMLGTILPTFLFNKGAPMIGTGLTAIVSSIELPLAVIAATLFLGEAFSGLQWAGVALIIAAIILSNAPRRES